MPGSVDKPQIYKYTLLEQLYGRPSQVNLIHPGDNTPYNELWNIQDILSCIQLGVNIYVNSSRLYLLNWSQEEHNRLALWSPKAQQSSLENSAIALLWKGKTVKKNCIGYKLFFLTDNVIINPIIIILFIFITSLLT